jgi:hypothetical protein
LEQLVQGVDHWYERAVACGDAPASLRLAPIKAVCRIAAGRSTDGAWIDTWASAAPAIGDGPVPALTLVFDLLGDHWPMSLSATRLAAEHAGWSDREPNALQRRVLRSPWLGLVIDAVAAAFYAEQPDPVDALRRWCEAIGAAAEAPGLERLTNAVEKQLARADVS